jgi:hypothetical protein
MPSDDDDGSIGDDAGLLRRIHPDQVVPDQNRGGRRPSSAAFKPPELSVDAEPVLAEDGLDWTFSLDGYEGWSLVRFLAGSARQQGLPVVHDPCPDNRAHTLVRGKKTQGIANFLVRESDWVHCA